MLHPKGALPLLIAGCSSRGWVACSLLPRCALLQELDSEGRVTITDHGAFVLFNLYGD